MAGLLTTVVDVNSTTLALTGNENTFIKFHSDARATMSGDGIVLSYDFSTIRNGSVQKFGLSNDFDNIESNVFTFHGVDIDSITHTETVEVDMIDYIKPTCNFESASMDGEGNITISCLGNFFNKSFGKVTNTITVKIRYAQVGISDYGAWQTMTVSKSGNTYYAYYTLADLDYTKNYIFEVKVNDKLEEKTAIRTFSSKPIFHWGKDDFTFEVPQVRIGGDSTLPSGKGYGNYLMFGDGENCYIAEENTIGTENDDFMTIYARAGINLTTKRGGLYINGKLMQTESGEWEPDFAGNAINSWHEYQGWYSKVGQVVTVGFRIKATCRSGYDNTQIVITGLPYTPVYAAAGGGLISGAYVAGDCTFQCFVAEEDGTITTRVQSCNETSDYNIYTTANSCNYRKGGGEVTLSGTITYLTYLTEE